MPKHKNKMFAHSVLWTVIVVGLLPEGYRNLVTVHAIENSSNIPSNPESDSATNLQSNATQPEKIESKIAFTRVDRSANAQAYAQASSLPKYYPPEVNRVAIPNYAPNTPVASYYAQAPSQSQLRSYPMAAEPYGAYWSDGESVQPDMQMWQSQGSYGSGQFGGMVQPQETMTYQPNYGGFNGMGGMGPTSPYAGYLEKQIASYPVMIYTLNDCIPCQKAKHLLATSYPDVRAHFLELSGNQPWQQQLQIDLQYLTGAMTFPYIFVCGQYIGGQSDLQELHESGQLRRMVSQCLKTAVPK